MREILDSYDYKDKNVLVTLADIGLSCARHTFHGKEVSCLKMNPRARHDERANIKDGKIHFQYSGSGKNTGLILRTVHIVMFVFTMALVPFCLLIKQLSKCDKEISERFHRIHNDVVNSPIPLAGNSFPKDTILKNPGSLESLEGRFLIWHRSTCEEEEFDIPVLRVAAQFVGNSFLSENEELKHLQGLSSDTAASALLEYLKLFEDDPEVNEGLGTFVRMLEHAQKMNRALTFFGSAAAIEDYRDNIRLLAPGQALLIPISLSRKDSELGHSIKGTIERSADPAATEYSLSLFNYGVGALEHELMLTYKNGVESKWDKPFQLNNLTFDQLTNDQFLGDFLAYISREKTTQSDDYSDFYNFLRESLDRKDVRRKIYCRDPGEWIQHLKKDPKIMEKYGLDEGREITDHDVLIFDFSTQPPQCKLRDISSVPEMTDIENNWRKLQQAGVCSAASLLGVLRSHLGVDQYKKVKIKLFEAILKKLESSSARYRTPRDIQDAKKMIELIKTELVRKKGKLQAV